MIKEKITHDTIFVVHKDTIVKIVELVKEPVVPQVSSFVQHFNDYSNCYTALATFAAFIALFLSIKSSNKSTRDSRQQVLCGKLEEICDIINTLLAEYPLWYSTYNLLETNLREPLVRQIIRKKDFDDKWKEAISEIDVNMYLDKVGRLFILINLYLEEKQNEIHFFRNKNKLKTDLKFRTLMFGEICNNILLIIKYKNIKYNSFPDKLPESISLETIVKNIVRDISEIIDYGTNLEGYSTIRNNLFLENFGERNEGN